MSREEVLKNLEELLKFEIDEKELSPELRKKIGQASLKLDEIHSASNKKNELEKLKPNEEMERFDKDSGVKIIGDEKYIPIGHELVLLLAGILMYILFLIIKSTIGYRLASGYFVFYGLPLYFISIYILYKLMKKDFWPRRAVKIENIGLKEKISHLNYQISKWKNEYDIWMKILAKEIFDELSFKERLPRGAIFNIGTLTHIEDKSQTISIKDSVIQRSQIGLQEGETEVSNSVIQKSKAGNLFQICPFCGAKLDLPRTPRYCPYCREELKPVQM